MFFVLSLLEFFHHHFFCVVFFFRFLSIVSHQTTVIGRLSFIIDTHYNLDSIRNTYIGWIKVGEYERESVLAELYYLYHKGSFHPIYVNITVVNQYYYICHLTSPINGLYWGLMYFEYKNKLFLFYYPNWIEMFEYTSKAQYIYIK